MKDLSIVGQYFLILLCLTLNSHLVYAKPPVCDMDKYGINRPQNCPAMRETDQALNKNYKKILSILVMRGDLKLKLRETQREWLTWVDSSCGHYVETISCPSALCLDNAHDECLIEVTKKRNSDFVKILENINKNGSNETNFSFSTRNPFEENESK